MFVKKPVVNSSKIMKQFLNKGIVAKMCQQDAKYT